MEKLLIAEDEMASQILYQELLSSKYEIKVVGRGDEALAVVASFNPDLILLDINMPGMNGYEACRQIKAIDAMAEVPVIFVSAEKQTAEILEGYEAGGVDYVVKPFRNEELLIKIKRNLAIQQSRVEFADQLNNASQAAFLAMSDASSYGTVSVFLLDALKCDDFYELSGKLFGATRTWGLKTTVQFRTPDAVITISDDGTHHPLEEQVILNLQDKGRIFSFGVRSLFTYKHASILIKNMPVDDDVAYGQLKDYLARVGDGVEGRVENIMTQMDLERRTSQLNQVCKHSVYPFA